VPTLTGAREVRSAQRQMLGWAMPCEWTTSMPSRARATRAFSPSPSPTATRATEPFPRTGIDVPSRTVR
jgi:hypothetical protein